MFCYQHFGKAFVPDLMSLGKSLGGGLPLSAVLLSAKTEKLMGAGEHGTTMGGNAVACAGGLALMDEIRHSGLVRRSEALGKKLLKRLEAAKAKLPIIKEFRGRGLMIGIELHAESAPVSMECFKRGLIVNATAGNVVRLHPPLTVSEADLKRGMDILETVLAKQTNKE
jgi:acetylornithine aminotransferase